MSEYTQDVTKLVRKNRNERISGYLEVTRIENKIRERRLACCGHVMRRLPTRPRRCLNRHISAGWIEG